MSHPKDTGKGGLTELPKFRTQSRPNYRSGSRTRPGRMSGRHSFKANALTHSATIVTMLTVLMTAGSRNSGRHIFFGMTLTPPTEWTIIRFGVLFDVVHQAASQFPRKINIIQEWANHAIEIYRSKQSSHVGKQISPFPSVCTQLHFEVASGKCR